MHRIHAVTFYVHSELCSVKKQTEWKIFASVSCVDFTFVERLLGKK